MSIGQRTIDEIKGQIAKHLEHYSIALLEVYSDLNEEETMTVSFSVKIAPKGGKNEVKTAISFVTGRVKDEITAQVNEGQLGLFNGPTQEKLPCLSCGGIEEHYPECPEVEGGGHV